MITITLNCYTETVLQSSEQYNETMKLRGQRMDKTLEKKEAV